MSQPPGPGRPPGGPLPEALSAVVERIHASAPLMVMEFAGAGAQALFWLHSVGGSSRTILEATDRYSPKSLSEALGYRPQRFTSPEAAAGLAQRALQRARHLSEPGASVFGLGLTATIATDRAKRGEHRCRLAVADGFGLSGYGLTLEKGRRERAGEEELVSLLALRAVADACGVLEPPRLPLAEGEQLEVELQPAAALAELEAGRRPLALLSADGAFVDELPSEGALLSGSFNPLHRGHLGLAEAAAAWLERPVVFELPLVNADKAEIDLAEARRRAAQFLGRAPLLLSRTPLFLDKARLLPGWRFVVGVDTAERVLQERFYGSRERLDETLRELEELGSGFLVAGRERGGRYRTLADLQVPREHRRLFEALPEEAFREDISSTQLRRAQRE